MYSYLSDDKQVFPPKKVTINSSDKEWITPKIKKLIAQRQKAYLANKFDQSKNLAKKVRAEIRKAKIQHNKKKAHLFHLSNSREWYKHINKIIGTKVKKLNLINIPNLANKTIDE